MEYMTVTAADSVQLDKYVNELFTHGWQLHGGVAVAAVGYSYENERKGGNESYEAWCYVQAMTRTASKELSGQ